jgi:hypothetical protein
LDPIVSAIRAKVSDARAHAANAVTEALRATPDGRATIRKATRSRSFQAAMARLDELWTDLCGPSVASRDGKLRDAREAFYRKCFELWTPLIPQDMRAGADEPTAAAIAARTMVLHGYDLRIELAGPIGTAERNLQSAVVRAGNREATKRTSIDLLAGWEQSTRTSLEQSVRIALGDALIALDVQAGRDQVRPEFLDQSPLES